MSRGRLIDTAAETVSGLVGRPDVSDAVARIEDVRVRNFDDQPHRVAVTAVDDDDRVVFGERYRLPPGGTACVMGGLDPGEYEITAEVDGRRRATATCAVDAYPDATPLVEVGNGLVAVTGADGRR